MKTFSVKKMLKIASLLLLASCILASCDNTNDNLGDESTADTTDAAVDTSFEEINYKDIYVPTLSALKSGITYTFDPRDITFDLSDGSANIIRYENIEDSVKSEIDKIGFDSPDYFMVLKNSTPITGLILNEGYTYSITVNYFAKTSQPCQLVAKNTVSGDSIISGDKNVFDATQNSVTYHYTVKKGDSAIVFECDGIEGVYVSDIKVELATSGPTLAQLTDENGYDWPIDRLKIGESEIVGIENCTLSAYNEMIANGYDSSARVLYTTGGDIVGFDRPSLFIPGSKYTITVKYYAESTGGYIIALDSTSGNHTYAGPNAFVGGYQESSFTATVGENGEYALTLFNVPNLYILSFNVKLEIPDESNDPVFSPPEKFYNPTLADLDKGYTFKFSKGRTPELSGGEYISISDLADSGEYEYYRSVLTEENGFSAYTYHVDRTSLIFDTLAGNLAADKSAKITMRIYCELPQDQIGMLCHGVNSNMTGSGDSQDANFKVKAVDGLKNVYDLTATVTPGPNTYTYITYYCTEEEYFIMSLKVKIEGIAPDLSGMAATTDHHEYGFVSNENGTAFEAENVSLSELVANMSGSPFTNALISSDSPLTDASNIGIVYDELDDILYPVPENKEFDLIINVGDFGISPANSPADNNAAFASLIKVLAGTNGLKKVYFPEGEYKFENTLYITDVDDVYFCAERFDKYADILITSWTRGIIIEDCKNIHFNNFTLDYETPSAVTGKVVSCDTASKKIVIRINDEFDLTRPEYNGGKRVAGVGSYVEYYYNDLAGKLVPNPEGNLLYTRDITDATYDEESKCLTLTFSSIKETAPNTVVNVAFTMYDHFGMHMTSCENLYLEQFNIYHTMGMSIGGSLCENVYFNGLRISPKPNTSRLMTATADGFHPYLFRGEIVVTNSIFEQSHDDSFNIKNAYQDAVSIQPTKVFFNPSTNIYVEAGDVIEIYRSSDLALMGEYTVKEVDEKNSCYIIDGYIDKKYSDSYTYRIANVSKGASVKIHNSLIGNKRNRGMLLQTRNIEISNCTFMNIVHGAINIHSVHDEFMEGYMPANVTVKNCKFLSNNWPNVSVFTWGSDGQNSVSKGAIKNITVENNFFTGQTDIALSLWGAGESEIKNNLFAFLNFPNAISISHSKNITVTDNLLVDIEDKEVCVFDYNNTSAIRQTDTECVVIEKPDIIYHNPLAK